MGGPGGGLWSGPEPSAVSAALRALAGTYTVAMGRPAAARRTWLDSADFRLYRSRHGADGHGRPGRRRTRLSSSAAADGATVTAGPDTARLAAPAGRPSRPVAAAPRAGARGACAAAGGAGLRHVRRRQVARRRGQDRAAAGPRASGHDLREPGAAARRAVADPAAGVRRGRRARRPDRAGRRAGSRRPLGYPAALRRRRGRSRTRPRRR